MNIVEITKQLTHEPWFHGTISREEAEARLHATGDFLVRQSKSYEGEIVLSAMGNGVLKHVFLIDEIGIVSDTLLSLSNPNASFRFIPPADGS